MATPSTTGPLLSICVPTFKRPHLLKVMIEALLPQAAEAGDRVEVWVLNNGADEDTAQVVNAARRLAPIKYLPKPFSETSLASTDKVIRELLAGEFLWLLGDHNLLAPGALQRILAVLAARPKLDAFYVNFRCATYPEHWPSSAPGGYSGAFHYLGNPELADREVPRWEELIRPESSLCTQMYAHVFRRRMWASYWSERSFGEPYSSGQTTYAHTWMLAETMFGRPSFYIGQPATTIFNGAQSWSDMLSRSKVFLIGLPQLVSHYERLGLSHGRLDMARQWAAHQAYHILIALLQDFRLPYARLLGRYVQCRWHDHFACSSLWRAFMDSQCCWLPRMLRRVGLLLKGWHRYWFYNCRPARWVHRHVRPTSGET